VLFIYEFFLNNPDDAPMDPVLSTFHPLTPSQKRIGKYFLAVAALLLVQIGAGTIMAHSYYDRISVTRGRPRRFLQGMQGAIIAHSSSVVSLA
jgi:hypothetical protein